jgi:phage I-like protein
MSKVQLPFLELADVKIGADNRSWVQAGKTGVFVSKRYGKFELSETMFDQIVTNKGEAPVDYDHFSTSPLSERKSPDAGKAAGWVLDVEKRQRGKELWANVEWTPAAAELIRNKEFRYISPTILRNFSDPEQEGKNIGAKLAAMALTNHPFLKGMKPVELTDDPDENIIELVAEVSIDERQQRIVRAFSERFNTTYDLGGYIVNTYDDHVIAQRDGKTYKIGYEVDDKLNVTFGESSEVVVSYKELSQQGETKMPDNPKVETSPEFIQLQSDLAAQNSKIMELSSRLDETQTENKSLRETIAKKDAKTKVDGLVNAGKLLPAQREWAEGYALSDNEGFDKFAATLPTQVQLKKEHGSGEAGDPVEATEDDQVIKEFTTLVNGFVKDEKLSYSDAIKKAQMENSTLALSYSEAMRNKAPRANVN